ncbi:protein trichome birefringence-like 19 [Rutidosis leptorrhynchoides]|uniref:protein trichome birefringence-like 19 n=1 Tax=Rutidosis leptorrhynchoides TaxID=125765 RepID=UPI003A992A37
MKVTEISNGKNNNHHQGTTLKNTSKTLILVSSILIILTVVHLYLPVNKYPIFTNDNSHKCDVFSGEWIPNPDAPYYNNRTCWAIHEHQNCQKYGRPDSDFMKWRWKPDGCDLPIFNPYDFLEIVRDKSLAFVGDSVGRNQMQSLICLLSSVEYPIDKSKTKDENFKHWYYVSYNFTLATFWSPFLVKSEDAGFDGPTHNGLFNVYLDEFNEKWTTQIDDFDYLSINLGHWFWRPMIYYINSQIIGCRFCGLVNVTHSSMTFGYRHSIRTAFNAINSRENFKGITILRTFAPNHFEGGEWNTGGNCLRKKPYKRDEIPLNGLNLELYMAQIEEFRRGEEMGKKRGLKYRLLDITKATLLRPDGHPSRYGHLPNANVTLYNDCVHWCLPGPIDTWNDFLLHTLKMESVRSVQEKLH